MRHSKKVKLYIALHIDDSLMVKNPEAIDEVVELLCINGLVLMVSA